MLATELIESQTVLSYPVPALRACDEPAAPKAVPITDTEVAPVEGALPGTTAKTAVVPAAAYETALVNVLAPMDAPVATVRSICPLPSATRHIKADELAQVVAVDAVAPTCRRAVAAESPVSERPRTVTLSDPLDATLVGRRLEIAVPPSEKARLIVPAAMLAVKATASD